MQPSAAHPSQPRKPIRPGKAGKPLPAAANCPWSLHSFVIERGALGAQHSAAPAVLASLGTIARAHNDYSTRVCCAGEIHLGRDNFACASASISRSALAELGRRPFVDTIEERQRLLIQRPSPPGVNLTEGAV